MSAPTDRPAAARVGPAAPASTTGLPATPLARHRKLLVGLIVAVVVMAILPDLLQYLMAKHQAETVRHLPPRVPLARMATWAAAAALLLLCSVILCGREDANRKISGLSVLLLTLLIPYAISPSLPGSDSIIRIGLAVAVTLAVWSLAAPVDGLKWVPITGSMLGAYSITGALIRPELMNFRTGSAKSLVLDWQLAGPFIHSNALGMYCVLSLALSPLIVSLRWRTLHGSILCAAVVASASRTALIAAAILALWWIFCWARSAKSVRAAGTVLVGLCAACVLILPLLIWNSHAFNGRAQIWSASLNAWEESRLVGLGIDWYTTSATSAPFFAQWADLRSGLDVFIPSQGHNLVVDTLVRSGLVGGCLLVLILLAATRSIRALDFLGHQIAYFGYLIVFLVVSCTENIWILLPNMALFPVVGLVFAVLVVSRHDAPAGAVRQSAATAGGVSYSAPRVSARRPMNPTHG